MIEYYVTKIFGVCVCLLPAWLRLRLGKTMGALAFPFVPRWRKLMAIDNAMQCLNVTRPEAEQVVKDSIKRFGIMFVDVLCFSKITRDKLHETVTLEGEEYLKQALAKNKGVICITAHFGNWELLSHTIATLGYPAASVAKKQNNIIMDSLINEYRTISGAHITYKTSVMEMVHTLTTGYCLGLLMDQDGGHDGVEVEFLGRNSSVPRGPAILARVKGCPVLPMLMFDHPDGTYTAKIYPEIPMLKTKNKNEDTLSNTRTMMKFFEEKIRQTPAMWFWLHNRWKINKNLYKRKE